MAWQGVEMEIQVPCAEGSKHGVRLRITGWNRYEVVHNPCEDLLGSVFARMAPCTHYLRDEFPDALRWNVRLKQDLVRALGKAGTQAVPVLIKALKDIDSEVRQEACKVLGAIGDTRAVSALIETLTTDESQSVRVAACAVLGKLGDPQAVPALATALSNGGTEVRKAACAALSAIGDPQAVPALATALSDGSKEVRKAACEALGKLGHSHAVPALTTALSDGSKEVRVAACAALSAVDDPQAVPALLHVLGDSEADVRRAAAEALGNLGDPQAVPALSVWAHAGEHAARNALQTLGQPALDLTQAVAQVAAQGTWDILIRALPNEKVREAVVGLGAPAVPALIQALGDSDANVRRASAEALGNLGDPQAVPALLHVLGDSEADVRRAAAEALGNLGDPQAVPALSVLAHVGESAAVAALQKLGYDAIPLLQAVSQVITQNAFSVLSITINDENTREAIQQLEMPLTPVLLEALKHSNRNVRAAACKMLGAINDSENSLIIIEALCGSNGILWDDEDAIVRAAACEALGAIGSEYDEDIIAALRSALCDEVTCDAAMEALQNLLGRPISFYTYKDDTVIIEETMNMVSSAYYAIGPSAEVWAISHLLSPCEDFHLSALETLEIEGSEAVPYLLEALNSDDEDMREAAYEALQYADLDNCDWDEFRSELIQLLCSGRWDVRERACEVLGIEEQSQIVPYLIRALDDEDVEVRIAACEALGKIGDPQALPYLAQAQNDEDARVSEAACDAIAQIEAMQVSEI